MCATHPNVKPVILDTSVISSFPPESFPRPTSSASPVTGNCTWRTLLSSPKTPTDTFVTGIATCALNGGHLALHQHTHAEIYYVISGKGKVSIDGMETELAKGSVVFVPGDAVHGVWCTGQEEGDELVWFYVFAAVDFADVTYKWHTNANANANADGKGPKAKL
ncbi:RmlC-like cupin [Pleomassaria siparia CBS 279.74]|uniref:RmlC-like cupin n=1 Tax=Pleomassaria siparia CBS 279.74 TaxID=1314801 RepID=A0A6G1K342_9PLEO|nr:RmlC-like cupin [Pleomassaria siparia CBS 279.74]